MRAALLIALAATACVGNSVSDRFDSQNPEYRAWKKFPLICGELPGHGGDTCRLIYANDVARTFEGGSYPEGSILVKEIYDADRSSGTPTTGKLQYVAVMRRLPGPAPAGLSDEGGWQFTYASTPGGSETHYSYCWDSCHVDAPYHGAWFDYSK